MKIGLYPGSFDPITIGHIGVIKKGSKLFDKLYVCVLKNASKTAMFTTEEKVEMIKLSLKEFKNVEVISENTLTVEACKKYGAEFILRGLRTSADFEYEFESNNVNSALDPNITTVLVMTNIEESYISSSMVRELIGYKRDYSKLVHKDVYEYIKRKEE